MPRRQSVGWKGREGTNEPLPPPPLRPTTDVIPPSFSLVSLSRGEGEASNAMHEAPLPSPPLPLFLLFLVRVGETGGVFAGSPMHDTRHTRCAVCVGG